ncbi:MAG: hypothetical protein JNK82_04755 [Myxococcaceae bacterium]|nr:hypothetical protein [Myxococcaceae bacterium]
MRTPLFLLALAASAAFAAPPTTDQVAKIQYDVKKAQAAVDKKYEGRELSKEEKKQQLKERADAENAVIEKSGVDRKDYARTEAKLSKDDRAAVAYETEKLEKQDKAAAQQAKQGGGNGEVVIEKGGQGQMSPEEEAAAMDKAAGFKSGGGKKRR